MTCRGDCSGGVVVPLIDPGAVCRVVRAMASGRYEGTKFLESNRFQDESQNLTGDIFMARIRVLVYTISLVGRR
jgi:hypothetical protein